MNNKIFWALFILAIATRFFYFNFPSEVVFDEVYFGQFVRSYFTGENFFDIHPPAGKLLIAGVAKIGGFKITDSFSKIGQKYDEKKLFILRFLPTLISVFFVILIYFLTLELTKSPIAAGLTGTMILFDNAIIVQSRYGLLDIFLLFFGFLAIYLYFIQEKNKKNINKIIILILAGLSLGLSYSIKWTGLATVPLLGMLAIYQLFKDKNYKNFFVKLAIIYIVSIIIYIGGFAVHFALLTKPGTGDAYLSKNFNEKKFYQKIIEINQKMFFYNTTIKDEHPFASKWYSWPINKKAIFYWQKNSSEEKKQELTKELENLKLQVQSGEKNIFEAEEKMVNIEKEIKNWNNKEQIWLLGNPVNWFFGLIAVMAGFALLLIKLTTKKFSNFNFFTLLFLFLAWLTNFLPFALINRPMFLYHYFFAFIFSIIIFSYLLSETIKYFSIFNLNKKTILTIFITLIFIGFAVISPVTYGFNFSDNYQKFIKFLL